MYLGTGVPYQFVVRHLLPNRDASAQGWEVCADPWVRKQEVGWLRFDWSSECFFQGYDVIDLSFRFYECLISHSQGGKS